MRVSIASYAFNQMAREGTMDLFGYLESCKYRYRINTADIWNGMMQSTDDAYLAKVREALDARELTLVNLCVDKAHIWEDDPDERDSNLQNALRHLHAAEVLGAKTVRIDAGGRDPEWSDEQFDLIVSRYREWAQRAHDHGYRVGPENHWGTELSAANMVKLCKAVDHPGFGVLLHFKSDEDAEMAPWAMHSHVTVEVSEGELESKMEILRRLDYQDWWGLETVSTYSGVAMHLARVCDVLERWRAEDSA